VITVFSEAEWESFCRVVDRPDWVRDPRFSTLSSRLRNVDELDRLVEEWTSERTDYEAMTALQAAGIAAGVVQNTEDQMHRDRQLGARGFFEEIEHLKKEKVVAVGIPLGLTGTPGRSGRAGAALGQDNDTVFRELLGMTTEEIERCIEVGAIEATD
jgi:benzylsuccinate CoA-transferase BbsF subunit